MDALITIRQFIAAGRRQAAELQCLALLDENPSLVPVLLILGALQVDRGSPREAVETFNRVIAVEPQNFSAMLQVAVAQFRNGEPVAARGTLEALIAQRPDDVFAVFHLGLLCEQASEWVLAEKHYRGALALRPDYLDAKIHLGLLLLRQSRSAEALPWLLAAWSPARPRADLAAAIARAQLDCGVFSEAVEYSRIATDLLPSSTSAWLVFGTALRRTDNALAAQQALLHANSLAPDNPIALAELGCNELSLGEYSSGLQRLERAHEVAPDFSLLRWLDALALPLLPDDAGVVQAGLAHFGEAIDALMTDLDDADSLIARDAARGLAVAQPFLLHYLPADTTALSFRYGDLVERALECVVGDGLADGVNWRALAHGGRIRVGFVSCELRLHTVTRYFSEWLMRLDRAAFEIHAWHLGPEFDDVTQRIADHVHLFHHEPGASPLDIANSIRDAQLDVLIYLEVGMDSRPQMLAARRLAPVQCVAYGHPVTSGLHNVDWFLSGAAIEPSHAESHYREQLERLPGLGVVPTRPPTPASGEWLTRNAERPLLLCLQSLFKLTPDFDHAIARIAKATDAEIVVFEFPIHCVKRFHARLARAFTSQGLDVERHVRILPRRDYAEFLGGIAKADVVLDSMFFSGGATSLDALSVGTPVVTLEGEFMRGRQTAGMLRVLDVPELIATDIDAYVEIAVALCRDAGRRSALRARLLSKLDRVFEPVDVIPALAEFIDRVARSAAEG
ncbi:MAG: tetratricopeptide repeat protein [Dokdonella sp.]